MPILIYGTSLGFINQTPILLAAELIAISSLLLLADVVNDPSRVKTLSFGFILLGAAIFSRLLSVWLPGVNAMAAIVMLTGIYGGSRLGLSVGMAAPFLTNMFFIQGAWTPFQMYAYGMLGLIAGIPWIARQSRTSIVIMTLFAIIMGVAFSLFMDSWTLISFGSTGSLNYYLVLVMQAIPFTIKYMISNGIFINLLNRPVQWLVKFIEKQ
ncbi:hypothetical protein G7081_05945 [Vagococcus coleopterorum]|uniref:ECF transporter S component n=1 Tax=Vagococcus coleopterorum TaxID=2714946 RepID=A0A6G8ANV2_9ENTE|nr:DUF6580 family putative transport protein [Vagococcus coleopterorum]QIL46649.1 hypothetical protein G7081_05945 [Vagococcus coleopterorum]